jgi:hypothetical protein
MVDCSSLAYLFYRSRSGVTALRRHERKPVPVAALWRVPPLPDQFDQAGSIAPVFMLFPSVAKIPRQ